MLGGLWDWHWMGGNLENWAWTIAAVSLASVSPSCTLKQQRQRSTGCLFSAWVFSTRADLAIHSWMSEHSAVAGDRVFLPAASREVHRGAGAGPDVHVDQWQGQGC